MSRCHCLSPNPEFHLFENQFPIEQYPPSNKFPVFLCFWWGTCSGILRGHRRYSVKVFLLYTEVQVHLTKASGLNTSDGNGKIPWITFLYRRGLWLPVLPARASKSLEQSSQTLPLSCHKIRALPIWLHQKHTWADSNQLSIPSSPTALLSKGTASQMNKKQERLVFPF